MKEHNRVRITRRKLWRKLGAGFSFLLLISLVTRRAYLYQSAEPFDAPCGHLNNAEAAELPHTHYLVSETYGWFDRTHFATGNPGQVIKDVAAMVDYGGGLVTISQGVRGGITGYTGEYRVSGHLTEKEVVGAALGIYQDWSLRFEEWQSQPPHGLFGPLSPFAVEDLPSQYLGFLAEARNLTMTHLFACYLGPVVGSDFGPPDFVLPEGENETNSNSGEEQAGIGRLQNKSFTPMVETEAGWQPVPWPVGLQMTPMASSPVTWEFVSDFTWYWLDDPADLAPPLPPTHGQPRPAR